MIGCGTFSYVPFGFCPAFKRLGKNPRGFPNFDLYLWVFGVKGQ